MSQTATTILPDAAVFAASQAVLNAQAAIEAADEENTGAPCRAWRGALDLLATLPAHTLAGVKAKADAFATCFGGPACAEPKLSISLIEDVRRLAG